MLYKSSFVRAEYSILHTTVYFTLPLQKYSFFRDLTDSRSDRQNGFLRVSTESYIALLIKLHKNIDSLLCNMPNKKFF